MSNNYNSNNINDDGGDVIITIAMRLVIVRRDYSRYNNMINITAKTDERIWFSFTNQYDINLSHKNNNNSNNIISLRYIKLNI